MLKAHHTPAPGYSRSAVCLLGLAIGVYALARVWRLTTYSLRPDEIFSLHAARHDWSGLLAVAARDVVHPPLFYSLLKIWTTIGGESELWLRLLPVLISLAALLPFVLLGRELELRAAELNLVLILMAVNGYLVYHAQELRMYSLLLGLTLCSLWLFARFVNRPDDTGTAWVVLAVTVLLVYTQYYGWLVVAAELVFLLIWNRARLPVFAAIVAGAALAFSPWLYLVVRRMIGRGLEPNIGSFAVPTWRDVAGFYAALLGSLGGAWMMLPGAVLFVGPVALWAARLLRSRRPADPRPAATFRWLVAERGLAGRRGLRGQPRAPALRLGHALLDRRRAGLHDAHRARGVPAAAALDPAGGGAAHGGLGGTRRHSRDEQLRQERLAAAGASHDARRAVTSGRHHGLHDREQ